MTDNQERWYRQTLSNNMNRAGKKLGYMLTKAYCVAWEGYPSVCNVAL